MSAGGDYCLHILCNLENTTKFYKNSIQTEHRNLFMYINIVHSVCISTETIYYDLYLSEITAYMNVNPTFILKEADRTLPPVITAVASDFPLPPNFTLSRHHSEDTVPAKQQYNGKS